MVQILILPSAGPLPVAMKVDLPKHLASVLQKTSLLHPADLASQKAALKSFDLAVAAGQSASTLIDLKNPLSAAVISDASLAKELAVGSATPSLPASPLERFVHIRTSPLLSGDPLTVAAKPESTQGPFLSAAGVPIWIDNFTVQKQTAVYVRTSLLGPPQLVAVIPIVSETILHPTPISTKVITRPIVTPILTKPKLGAGSAWFPSQLFVPGRPDGEFVGVKISGGGFTLAGTETAATGTITLAGAWSVALNITLDLPANPAPTTGVGADATNAVVHLPATLAINFSPTGLQVTFPDGTAQLYGDTVTLHRNANAPFFDAVSKSIVVPTDFQGAFNFHQVRSTLWSFAHASPVVATGWSLPVLTTDLAHLTTASSAGNFWFSLAAGNQVTWRSNPNATPLTAAVLVTEPGQILLSASIAPAAATQTFELWTEDPPTAAVDSRVDFTSTSTSTLLYGITPAQEVISISGAVTANLDRPLRVDGERLTIAIADGGLLIGATATALTVFIAGSDPAAASTPHIALALKNALLKVRPPSSLLIGGALSENRILSGKANLHFALRAYLPTLPDPYAANFDLDLQADTDQGSVSGIITWPTRVTPQLTFDLTLPPSDPVAAGATNPGLPLGSDFGIQLRGRQVLIDVSSAADQFGVLLPAQLSAVTVEQLSVSAPGQDVAVVTLPPISWEPMLTLVPSGGGDIPLPAPPNDGGPALFSVLTPEASALDPVSLLADFTAALTKQTPFNAWLPLPFGLVAQLNFPGGDPRLQSLPYFPNNTFQTIQPAFDSGLNGAQQLSWAGPPNDDPTAMDPVLPGKLVSPSGNYATGVLSENIHTELLADFGEGAARVPVRRYDLSGYGASLRSDWRDPESLGPAIIHVNFDTMVGRTAHEVIQMQSFLYPHYARVVRTITMDRTAGGWILREDSGWIATSDGNFAFQSDPNATNPAEGAAAFEPSQIHRGAVKSFTQIRNLQLLGDQFEIASRTGGLPTIWQQVAFDSEILFNTSGTPSRLEGGAGTSGGATATHGATGWIQVSGPTYETHSKNGSVYNPTRPASGVELFDLLAVRGNAQAPISCSLLFGGADANPGLTLRAARVELGCNQVPNTPHLVASVMGSPVLPTQGVWSVARMAEGDAAPNALDPATPVPLVAPTVGWPGADRWHLADAADITQLGDASTPSMVYGLVQSLGTQKVFFPRPRINTDANPVSFPQVPQLADMGALLAAAGIFPGLEGAFDFATLKSLAVNAGQVGFSDTFLIGAPGALKSATLADLGGADGIQLLINYNDESNNPTKATITVDPSKTPQWELELERVSFAIVYRGAPLISLFAKVGATSTDGPQVKNLVVKYEGILSALETIFSNLQQVARFLPGGEDAGLVVGFSEGRLSVTNSFSLPDLPLGAGDITNVALEMGFDVAISPFAVEFTAGIGSETHPFNWVVSPLSGNGFVTVGITTQGLNVAAQAGLGLGLAIDLGIASGSASVALAIEITTEPNPFEVRGVLSGRASVDVLDGLASATITLAAGLGIIPPPQLFQPPFLPPQLLPPPDAIPPLTIGIIASVSVGIHLTVCWVADVDWDGYWQFRQDLTTPKIPIPF